MRAHRRHLANTIEIVHPSAHSIPQPKRQIDRFSRFCTAQGRKCRQFAMGAPIHHNCIFPWGIWTCNTRCLWPMRANNPNGTSIGSTVFAQMAAECPYTLQWFACFPFKIAPCHGGSGPHVTHGSLDPPECWTQRATRSLQQFLHGSLVWQTDRPTDRPTDHATRSVTIGRIYVRSTNAKLTWETAKPHTRFMLRQTISPLLRRYLTVQNI